MKQKMKEHKGITLVALILTIIVLLILAVVAISAVKGDGIISHAKNARSQYTKAQTNEQELLSNYELMLAQETGNAWKQEKTKVTKGDKTLEVGDTITNFKAGGKTWKVLGAENGKLLLTTTENVNDRFTLDGSDATIGVWDEATASYKNAEKALDDECKAKIELTETEQNQVAELRSIKVEDINRVTGYNPEKTGDGKAYNEGQIDQYGNEVTYSIVKDASGAVTGVKYDSKVKSDILTDWTYFRSPNTSTDITSPYTVTSTFYTYDASGLRNDCKAAFDMLLGNYWLKNSCVNCSAGVVGFGVRVMRNPCEVSSQTLYNTWNGWDINIGNGVRPVVSLKSDVKLTETSTGSGEWNIS